MKKPLALGLISALATALALDAAARPPEQPGPPLAHMVFFSLKDRSQAAKDKFVASCHEHLAGHEGTTYFSVGVLAEDVEEPVSVKDFDVALHVVFEGKAAKEAYLVHPRHKAFVEENRGSWAKVRVFDSYLTNARR